MAVTAESFPMPRNLTENRRYSQFRPQNASPDDLENERSESSSDPEQGQIKKEEVKMDGEPNFDFYPKSPQNGTTK